MGSQRRNATVGIGVAAIAIVFYAVLGSGLFSYAREHDFLAFYTGAKRVLEGQAASLYNYDVQRAAEAVIAPNAPVTMPYIRPPFYAALLAPLALLPLNSAFIVWMILQIAGLAVCWIWAYRRFGPDALVYCALFMPAARGIMHGQDCVFLLLLMLGAFLAMERKQDGLAGALAGLTLMKFHMLLLLPLAMLARRRWKMFGGYAAVAAVEVCVSLWMVGVSGVRQYLALITRKDLATLNPSPDMMVNIHAIAANIGIDAVWFKPMLVLAIVAIVLTATRNWFWIAALGSLLLPPHTYVYDLAILLIPGLIAVFNESEKLPRIAAAVALIPIPYLFTFFGRPLAIVPSLVLAAVVIALAIRPPLPCETITASP